MLRNLVLSYPIDLMFKRANKSYRKFVFMDKMSECFRQTMVPSLLSKASAQRLYGCLLLTDSIESRFGSNEGELRFSSFENLEDNYCRTRFD